MINTMVNFIDVWHGVAYGCSLFMCFAFLNSIVHLKPYLCLKHDLA